MSSSTARKVIPPVYVVLIVVGFLINAAVGVAVAVIGGMVMGIGWSALRDRREVDQPSASAEGNGQEAPS